MESKVDYKRVSGVAILLFAGFFFGYFINTAIYSTRDVEQAPYWWRGLRMTGTLTDLAPNLFKIRLENGEEKSFAIDKLTKITLMGNFELKKGTSVTVIYKPLSNPDEPPTARWIRESLKSAGATETASPSITPAVSPVEEQETKSPSPEVTSASPEATSAPSPQATSTDAGSSSMGEPPHASPIVTPDDKKSEGPSNI